MKILGSLLLFLCLFALPFKTYATDDPGIAAFGVAVHSLSEDDALAFGAYVCK